MDGFFLFSISILSYSYFYFLSCFLLDWDTETLPRHGRTTVESDDTEDLITDRRDIPRELEIYVDLSKLGCPLDVLCPSVGDHNLGQDPVIIVNLFVTGCPRVSPGERRTVGRIRCPVG